MLINLWFLIIQSCNSLRLSLGWRHSHRFLSRACIEFFSKSSSTIRTLLHWSHSYCHFVKEIFTTLIWAIKHTIIIWIQNSLWNANFLEFREVAILVMLIFDYSESSAICFWIECSSDLCFHVVSDWKYFCWTLNHADVSFFNFFKFDEFSFTMEWLSTHLKWKKLTWTLVWINKKMIPEDLVVSWRV